MSKTKKQKRKYHSTTMWTDVDDYIEEVAEWMNNNCGIGDFVVVNIVSKNNNGASVYSGERKF